MKALGGGAPALIGRADELAALSARIDVLKNASGAVALISGEAGVGKTRLVDELRHRVTKNVPGAVVATAYAYDYAQAPYAPIRDLLSALEERLPKVLARDARLREALEPIRNLGETQPGDDPHAAQRRVLDAFVVAVGKFAAAAPLVLVVEDVHWIDRASADALLHLAAQAERHRVFLLLTFRSNDDSVSDAGAELAARLTRRSIGGQIALHPLSPVDALALVDAAAPAQALDASSRRTICELGDGNPLLLLELVGHALEEPRAVGASLPLSLTAIVSDRIAHFEAEERELLRVAALLVEFDAATLAEMSGQPERFVLPVLRKGRDRRVLVESPPPRATYAFRHALIRRAISDELLAGERRTLHARVAERMEQRGAPAATVAHHYELAGNAEHARTFFKRAGDEAMAAAAFSDAAEMYRRVIDERAITHELAGLYRAYIDASGLGGRRLDAMPALKSAIAWCAQIGDFRDGALYSIELSRWLFAALDDAAAAEAAEHAILLIERAFDPVVAFEAHALLAWHRAHERKLDAARAALADALRYYDSGTPRAKAWFHEARAVEDVHSGRAAAWRDECEAMLACARQDGYATLFSRLDSAAALALASNVEDFAYARERLAEAIEIGVTHRLARIGHTTALAAFVEYTLGNLEDARKRIIQTLSTMNDAPNVSASLARVGIPVALALGDEALLRRCADENVLDIAYQTKAETLFGPVAAGFAEKLLRDGRQSEAHLLVERAVARLTSAANNLAIVALPARLGLANAGDTGRRLLEALTVRSRSAAATLSLVDAYATAGEARRAHAREAVLGFHDLGWPLWEAQALELAGDAGAARAIYAACGAVTEMLRLDAAAARSDAPPGRLSRREWDVAQLVSQGKSNRAIAETLVLSERTVENHIASIFNKLSLRSRAEIAAFVTREEHRPLAR